MARTRGAVDKRPRKKSNKPKAKAQGVAPIATPPAAAPAEPQGALPPVNPEFLAAIAATMQEGANEPQAQPGGHESTGTSPTCPPAAALAEEVPLTREAWQGVLRVPFRVLALATQTPAVAQIGAERARELAKPSYPIFEYYAKAYLALNPDSPLSLAWAATGLVLSDIAADVLVALHQARQARQHDPVPGPAAGGPLNQAA